MNLLAVTTIVLAVAGPTVTLEDAAGLSVGDRVIIESTHGYGEAGLDGVFNFSNAKANFYYTAAPVGRSFVGTVKDISGNAVTLDRDVPEAAAGKRLYRDNYVAVKYWIENKKSWPKGESFAVACEPAPLRCYLTDEPHEIDFNGCELFAPRGCQPLSLTIARVSGGGVSNKAYKNLTLRGNVRSAGYGLCVEKSSYTIPPAFSVAGTSGANSTTARNIRVDGFTFIDNWRALDVSRADGVTVTDCVASFTDQLHHYIQWEFQASSSANVTLRNCRVDTDFVHPGFEAFKSQGVVFESCGGRNTLFSSNSSGDVLFKNCSIVWDEESPNAWLHPNTPLLNINRNIDQSKGERVSVRNFSVDYLATPYPGRIFNTINASPNTGANIRGVSLRVPSRDLTTPNQGYLVRSDDAATTASGFDGELDTGHQYVRRGVPTKPDPITVKLAEDEWRAVLSILQQIKSQVEGE